MAAPFWTGLRGTLAGRLADLPPSVHRAVPIGARRNLRHLLGRYYAWEEGFDFHAAPVPRAGETTGPPDFVGIGVQKAGTSWWYHLLLDHPQLSARPTIHKERHFFARFGSTSFGASDCADYHAWFPRVAGTLTGEWTPDYFFYPWVPPLLARCAPDATLLLLLRDPIERFRSGLAHQARGGAGHIGSVVAEALGRSLYAEALRRWLDHVPASRLVVLQYERCVAHPAEELASTYRAIGVDEGHRPRRLSQRVNRTLEAKVPLDDELLDRLRELFLGDLTELARLAPSLDLSLWPTAAGLSAG